MKHLIIFIAHNKNPIAMKLKIEKPILQFDTTGQIDKAKEYLTDMLIARIDAEQPEKSTMYIALSLRQFVGGFFDKEGSIRYTGIGAKTATLVVSHHDNSKAHQMWLEVREGVLANVSFSKKGAAIFQDAIREMRKQREPVTEVVQPTEDKVLPFELEQEKPKVKRGRPAKKVQVAEETVGLGDDSEGGLG